MKKIITLFKRNYDGDRLVREAVVEGAEWVLRGEGVATRKFDGSCCMIRGGRLFSGRLFKRYDRKTDRKTGRQKPAPRGWEPAQELPDETTGHWPGWVPIEPGNPEDKWHWEAFEELVRREESILAERPLGGTYELVGPKIQGNPEAFGSHLLIRHGQERIPDCPRTFEGIKAYLSGSFIEGIVWHHPDGRMVKIKGKDFGLKRK